MPEARLLVSGDGLWGSNPFVMLIFRFFGINGAGPVDPVPLACPTPRGSKVGRQLRTEFIYVVNRATG